MNRFEKTPRSQQSARKLIGGLALVFAVAGQIWLFSSPAGLWPGLILMAIAWLLFIGSSVYSLPAWTEVLASHWFFSYSVVMVGAAIVFAILAIVVGIAWLQLDRTNYLLALVFWLGSALTYLAAFARNGAQWQDWRAWLRAHRAELIGIALITLGAAAIRFYQLGTIPRVIDGDEGRMGQIILTTDRNPLANPFTLWENIGSLYLQVIGLGLSAFGQTPLALRLIPALGGTLAIPALYVLGRRLFGIRVGFLAAIFLALAHAHIHFSRIVSVIYIQGTWLVPLQLYFLISGLEKRSSLRLAVGGMLLGLHLNIYVGAQLMVALLLIYLVAALWLCRPIIQQAARQIMAFWSGTALVALPMLVQAWRNPSEFFARLNSDGTFQSGWLANRMAETGQSALQIIAERVAHAFLSLNYYPAIDFYGANVPVLESVTSALFMLGLGYVLWRWRDPRFLLLNAYFWLPTIAIGVFSIPPTADSYRMLIVLPAAILLAAVGLDQAFVILGLNQPERRMVRLGASVFVIIAILVLNLSTYFFDFGGHCRYGGDPQTRFASYLGNYLRTLDRETPVYLLSDDNFRYGTHSSVDFLSRNFPVTNVPEPVTSLALPSHVVIVAVPPRAKELQT